MYTGTLVLLPALRPYSGEVKIFLHQFTTAERLRNTARLTKTMSYTFIDFILLMTAETKTNFEILGFQNYGMQSS